MDGQIVLLYFYIAKERTKFYSSLSATEYLVRCKLLFEVHCVDRVETETCSNCIYEYASSSDWFEVMSSTHIASRNCEFDLYRDIFEFCRFNVEFSILEFVL